MWVLWELGPLVPVQLQPAANECSVQQETEINIAPTVLYKPVSFLAPQSYQPVNEVTQPGGTISYGNNNNPGNNSAKLTVCSTDFSLNSVFTGDTGGKPYGCDICQYKCSRKSNLVLHRRTHTGEKPYSCSECQYTFSIKHSLVRHMRTHTGEKPYGCSVCQYKFSKKQNLDTHMRTHTGEKPYSCSECQSKFSIKQTLVRHMRTHIGEKPYSCCKCQYKCTRKRHLVQHIHTTHSQSQLGGGDGVTTPPVTSLNVFGAKAVTAAACISGDIISEPGPGLVIV